MEKDIKKEVNKEIKKIALISSYVSGVGHVDSGNSGRYIQMLFEQQNEIITRLNEIIKYINNEEK